MPDGSVPATAGNQNLVQILNQLERAINRDERGDALELTARAQAIALQAALTAPCPDCGSTDEGHATPCGKRARTTLKRLAAKLQKALTERERTETSVIVATLALEGQGADFDYRIAQELKAHAWDGLADIYVALHQAMHLIPPDDRPDGFLPDAGVSLDDDEAEGDVA